MKIEDSFCSLEQAKKLKELGMVQNSPFMYAILKVECDGEDSPGNGGHFVEQKALVADFEDDGNWTLISTLDSELLRESLSNGSDIEDFDCVDTYDAISGSEIGLMVPIVSTIVYYNELKRKWASKWCIELYPTEALARTNFLIENLEHEPSYSLISIENLNEALKS